MQQKMQSLDQKVKDFAIHVGLNNMIARETCPKNDRVSMEKTANPGRSRTPTERVKYQLWPNVKKTDGLAGRHTPDIAELQLKSPAKEGTLGRRRKISVPELGPMTTVQEKHMDSPTIPGHFPFHERSNSAPGSSWDRGVPRGTFNTHIQPYAGGHCGTGIKRLEPSPLEDCEQTRMEGRSFLQCAESEGERPLKRQEMQRARNGQRGPEEKAQKGRQEKPPEVPPKSPHLTAKASNSHVPTSTSDNAKGPRAVGTVGSRKQNIDLCRECVNQALPNGTEAQTRTATPPGTDRLEAAWSTPPREVESSTRARALHAAKPSQTSVGVATSEKQTQTPSEQRRDVPQESVINRGRPKKKNHLKLDIQIPVDTCNRTLESTNHALPLGIPVHTAGMILPYMEVDKLQSQAREQAERFEILKFAEVKSLSRELHALDQRCDYLRETHASLRTGRCNLHTRMISYLRSPRVSKFSTDAILRQQEALAELDQSIDEWYTKLEHAENRRARIRQKLLEHLAATLVLRQPVAIGADGSEAQTPPTSPEKSESPNCSKRQDVESIKIYADAELQSLFLNIENQMEKMVSTGHSDSPSPARNASSPDERVKLPVA